MSSESLFTQCTGCNNSVSKSIKRCPNCGKRVKKLTFIQWIGCAFILLGVYLVTENKRFKNKKHL